MQTHTTMRSEFPYMRSILGTYTILRSIHAAIYKHQVSIFCNFTQPWKYGSHASNLYLKCMLAFVQKSQKIIITISIFKGLGCIRKTKQTHRIYSYTKLWVPNSHIAILIETTIVLSSTMSLNKRKFLNLSKFYWCNWKIETKQSS